MNFPFVLCPRGFHTWKRFRSEISGFSPTWKWCSYERRGVVGGWSEEFIQTDTNFFNNHLNATNLLEYLCVSQGQVLPIPTHWLELCSFIHSFIPQICSEHPQHVRHLSRSWRHNSEQSKWGSAFTDLSGGRARSVRCVIGAAAKAAWAYWSLGKALFYPTQSTTYPCSQHILTEHLRHARALAQLKGIQRTQTDFPTCNKHKASHSYSLCII